MIPSNQHTRSFARQPSEQTSLYPCVRGTVRKRNLLAGSSVAPLVCLLAATACGIITPIAGRAQIQFEDATTAAGITYVGESYGSSWGDYNSDGWPDVFVSNHRNPPALYVNRGNGTFENRAGAVDAFQNQPNSDQHGGAWADWDNDGDTDLFVSAGARNSSQFLVNNGQFLIDRTAEFTFDVKAWGGRLPVWFDFTHDGKLDFAMSVQGSKPIIFQQTATDFVPANFAYGNNCPDTDFTQLADVTRDGFLDWLCITQAPYPAKVYDITKKPFVDRTSLFPPNIVNSTDSLFADIDGDLVSDAFAVRGKDIVSGAEIVGPRAIEAHLVSNGQHQKGISFVSSGNLEFELHWNARNVSNIFIGASGVHPPAPGPGMPIRFSLSSTDPNTHGLRSLSSNPGKESIFIGYDAASQTWQYWVVSTKWNYVYAYLDSTQSVSNLQVFGLITALDTPRPPVFIGSSSGSYVDRTAAVGMNVLLPCNSVAAADFDNDMDLDLFFVCRNAVTNEADRLYENVNGAFVRVANAGGAAGPTGPGTGLGENLSLADYDVDGRVDIIVQNGVALFPEKAFSNGGPDKLFRNISNPNNRWIEIDLVGTTSNRDAVGARVIATAGGASQLREQGGNYRRWSQNHARLHFGLGSNATVDLQVSWPSGLFQTFNDVPADRLYRITEGAGIEAFQPGTVDPSPCGDARGVPAFDPGVDAGVFMGKDCASGAWTMIVTGGGSALTYRGDIVSSEAFTSVTGTGLAGNDRLDTSDPKIIDYFLQVGGRGQDRVDFSYPAGSDVCFDLDTPSGATVKVGEGGIQVPVPFDLETLESCQVSEPLECGMPTYNAGTEQGVFVGRNCSSGAWQFRATAGGAKFTYEGAVTSDQPFTNVSGFGLESFDELNWNPGSSQFSYSLTMQNAGQDGFNFTFPDGSSVCLDVSSPQGAPVYLGPDRIEVSVPFDPQTGGPCM